MESNSGGDLFDIDFRRLWYYLRDIALSEQTLAAMTADYDPIVAGV